MPTTEFYKASISVVSIRSRVSGSVYTLIMLIQLELISERAAPAWWNVIYSI